MLIPRSGGACHNSLEIGISNADPCYTAAVGIAQQDLQ